MDLADAFAADVTRRLAPIVRDVLAAHVAACTCAVESKARPDAPPRSAYTVREVAASLGVSAKHVYRMCAAGEIKHRRLGHRVLIPVEVLGERLDGEVGGRTVTS